MKIAALDDIALAQATPQQARSALGAAMTELTPEIAQRIYSVLRAWVWKAVDGRRRDGELRDWFDVLRRTRAQLEGDYVLQAERLRVLHDLVRDSIDAADVLSPEEVMKRSHVRNILKLLSSDLTEQVDRALIGAKLGLKQANLTRVLNMMSSAGLIERATYGKQALYQLTPLGVKAARSLHKIAPSTEVAPFVARIAEPPTISESGHHSRLRKGRRTLPSAYVFSDPKDIEEYFREHRAAEKRNDEAARAREHSLASGAKIRSESHKNPYRAGTVNMIAVRQLHAGKKRRAKNMLPSVENKTAKSVVRPDLAAFALGRGHSGE